MSTEITEFGAEVIRVCNEIQVDLTPVDYFGKSTSSVLRQHAEAISQLADLFKKLVES